MHRLPWVSGRAAGQWIAVLGLVLFSYAASAKEAQWIWSPAYEKEMAPEGSCYFRKTFNLGAPESGTIQISADDNYELYVNGRLVGSGQNWKQMDQYDITKFLMQGPNTVSVRSTNSEGNSAGLVARVIVKAQGNTHVEHSTDPSWKTMIKEFPGWQKQRFNDTQWLAARAFGNLGMTLPWGNEVVVAGAGGRFKVTPEFHVEWVVDPKDTGSLICMCIDEFGQIIASREGGGLIIIRDDDRDGLVETVETYCDEVKNCQGLLALSGKIYAIGEGSEGAALYRLSDGDQDGKIDRIEPVLKFSGEIGEHGPHALTLGPDGLLYIVIGNFAHTAQEVEDSSPYRNYYEGDLIQPRYEDATGHAVGIKAPAGTIIRTDVSGSAVELFAGGMQNPYDLVFNSRGDLFTCDSDMEWDMGMPWYRPTRLNHLSAGSEFGWRSGWAKWPNYFVDSLPPTLELGRGSPAGMEVYNHVMFPARYHDAVFVCDWSRGRILALRTKPHGGSYKATAEVFLEGAPLNATDICVGADGWLYFCTGGRDTEGGIYRVVWDGKVPPEILKTGAGVQAALNQPQLNSAFARQRVALVKQQLGELWLPQLTQVARDAKAKPEHRVRALELLQLFGPDPSPQLLIDCSRDKLPELRAKAAFLMGLHADEDTQARLTEMLGSELDLGVQRAACEAVARSGEAIPTAKLIRLLGSPDRYVSWAAGRALQQAPRNLWEGDVLSSSEARIVINGSVALLGANDVRRATADAILARATRLLKGYLSDTEFLDLARVIQVALMQGEVEGDEVPELRKQLAEEYPSRDYKMNRELVRLLVYLQEPSMASSIIEQMGSDIPNVEKMQLLSHARFLEVGWTTELKLEILRACEEARALQGGKSFAGYIENIARDFFATFSEEEQQLVLAGRAVAKLGASVLAKLPEKPSKEILAQIVQLDRQVKKQDSEAAKRLRIGICAVLGVSGDPPSMAYLRELFEAEPDRRVPIAIALAQDPSEKNWPLLVRSLSIVEGAAAQEVLMRLGQVDRAPDDPEAYRQAILRGLMLRENGGKKAVDLLEKWTEQKLSEPDASIDTALAAWQDWFAEKYPELPEPKLPVEKPANHWTYQELMSVLTGPQAMSGAPQKGLQVFEKATCVRCHRMGERGDMVGPDLTNVSRRFQKKEILESIIYPSHVISDQYATQTVTTTDGRSYQGMVAPSGDGKLVILQANGDKVVVAKNKVEELSRNKTSAMPEGLLNPLTLEEIADLFAYLSNGPVVAKQPAGTKTK